jgi:penicillin-binding protein 1A
MDVGGKTGTTQSNADGWFIGVTPKLVAGAWVGGAYPSIGFQSSQLGQGAVMALPIFGKYFAAIQKDPKFRSISNARYPVLNRTLQNKMDCDPFKEDLNFFERLFGKKKNKKAVSESAPDNEKKENVFRKIGNLFKKKN